MKIKESWPATKILLEFLKSYIPIVFLQNNSLTVIFLKLKTKAIRQAVYITWENVSVQMITLVFLPDGRIKMVLLKIPSTLLRRGAVIDISLKDEACLMGDGAPSRRAPVEVDRGVSSLPRPGPLSDKGHRHLGCTQGWGFHPIKCRKIYIEFHLNEFWRVLPRFPGTLILIQKKYPWVSGGSVHWIIHFLPSASVLMQEKHSLGQKILQQIFWLE